MKENKTAKELTQIALFIALLTVCAWICIPAAVPFTMQTFGLFLCLGLLGGKAGSLAVGAYLLLGGIGVPVFAGFTGGVGAFLGSGGGYLVGFFFAALFFWGLEGLFRDKLLLRMVLSQLLCYGVALAWWVAVRE